jgi:hypothetical protein
MHIKLIGGKCGCPTCAGHDTPNSRAGWKSKRNKRGGIYGNHIKGGKGHKGGGH